MIGPFLPSPEDRTKIGKDPELPATFAVAQSNVNAPPLHRMLPFRTPKMLIGHPSPLATASLFPLVLQFAAAPLMIAMLSLRPLKLTMSLPHAAELAACMPNAPAEMPLPLEIVASAQMPLLQPRPRLRSNPMLMTRMLAVSLPADLPPKAKDPVLLIDFASPHASVGVAMAPTVLLKLLIETSVEERLIPNPIESKMPPLLPLPEVARMPLFVPIEMSLPKHFLLLAPILRLPTKNALPGLHAFEMLNAPPLSLNFLAPRATAALPLMPKHSMFLVLPIRSAVEKLTPFVPLRVDVQMQP